jgi:hypothetical protein
VSRQDEAWRQGEVWRQELVSSAVGCFERLLRLYYKWQGGFRHIGADS